MTPQFFIQKWRRAALTERAAAQSHFNDLCALLGEPTPTDADPLGEWFGFEKGARKTGGGQGWADVWKKGCFAWEYKGKHKDLGAALRQLQQYALALDNPPLLIVCDLDTIEIHTNFTNTVHVVHRLTLDDLADGQRRQWLKWAFADPDRLKPEQTTAAVTAQAAETFAQLAQRLRERGHDPHQVAHFVTRLLFCMFAEDIGLLPRELFTRLLAAALPQPERFVGMAQSLFAAMSAGGVFGVEVIAWFNGGLFNDPDVIPLDTEDLRIAHRAALLDWAAIEPAIFGTLFERGLDPDKRSQLGAHYTDRASIERLIAPVIREPLRAEWQQVRAAIAARLDTSPSPVGEGSGVRAKKQNRQQAEQMLQTFLERLRTFRVLDPACGSGNFLYLALQTLKDLEHQVMLEAEQLGLQRGFPVVGPEAVLGIEINPYAAELARVTVWIGEIQWMLSRGYSLNDQPILKPLDQIFCRDALLTVSSSPFRPPRPSGDEPGVREREPGGEGAVLPSPSGRGAGGEGGSIHPPLPLAIRHFARQLRRDQTDAENLLWRLLRNRRLGDFKFRRQHPIPPYILDFYCHEAGLALELDGGQHLERQAQDEKRSASLAEQGIRVLRFWNHDVLTATEGVLEKIWLALHEAPSPPAPLPEGEGSQAPSPPAPLPEGAGWREADWPAADVIVGNPPFLGGSKILGLFGDQYANTLRTVYQGRVPGGADLVCYWFEKARALIEQGKAQRAGLVATNSIRGGSNRKVLERILKTGAIFNAWSDEPWINDGAAVRVSLVCFGAVPPSPTERAVKGEGALLPSPSGRGVGGEGATLDGQPVAKIYADLTADRSSGEVNLTQAKPLAENLGVSFQGTSKKASFDILGSLARSWLKLPNPHSKSNSDVLRLWANGLILSGRAEDLWIIDFGCNMTKQEASLYEIPFDYVLKKVKPERDRNNREAYRKYWWRHAEPRPGMRSALSTLSRYIATIAHSKHRFFVWLDKIVCPDQALIVIARDDDTTFGILHSRFHELWALRLGTSLEDRPRYTPTTTFETFPFPEGLQPSRPSALTPTPLPEGEGLNCHARAIADAARRLVELRDNWLNPPEWVRRVPEVVPGYPDRLLPVDDRAAAELKKRTLTNLYNQRPAWLANAHRALDEAVAAAYGWPADLGDEDVLRRLLALNRERANAQTI